MKLFDTLKAEKQEFTPLQEKKVLIYVCGVTPYDTTHLGHAFVYVTFDALKRYLIFKGYQVLYTQNVTDIDDDIIKRAKREQMDWQELGQIWTKKFITDLEALNVKMPDHFTQATSHIDTIIEIIKSLIKKDIAYEKNGNVYFDILKYPKYSQLSKFSQTQMELIAAERGANLVDPNKKNRLDFILWQKSRDEDFDPNFKTEPAWDSPWGKGRPGWHIECSAMVKATLGDQIDIHGGGRDLVFPHHESEIAQSESFTGKVPFTSNWMHIAMVQYLGEKMSKSLGNLILVSDLLKKYSPMVIRWFLLSNHYRNPWEYREESIEEVAKQVKILENLFAKESELEVVKDSDPKLLTLLGGLEDDFDTSLTLARVLEEAMDKKPSIPHIKKVLDILGFNFDTSSIAV